MITGEEFAAIPKSDKFNKVTREEMVRCHLSTAWQPACKNDRTNMRVTNRGALAGVDTVSDCVSLCLLVAVYVLILVALLLCLRLRLAVRI